MIRRPPLFFFFFNDTATTEIYPLSLHDALPIYAPASAPSTCAGSSGRLWGCRPIDRKSTRLNSSHVETSYAVFCLKQKNSDVDDSSPGRGRLERADEARVLVSNVRRHHLSRRVRRAFFFNDTPTTEIYTLSLHDALPI